MSCNPLALSNRVVRVKISRPLDDASLLHVTLSPQPLLSLPATTHLQPPTLAAPLCAQGALKLAPNAKNHRDLDFQLTYTHKGKLEGTKSATLEFKMR